MSYRKWTLQEKQKLAQIAENLKDVRISWVEVSLNFQGRTAKQCYDQYTLQKKSTGFDREYTRWTRQEESDLYDFIDKYGIDWNRIQRELFPGRSISQLKNKYRQSANKSNKSAEASDSIGSQPKILVCDQTEDLINQLKQLLK